MKNLIIIFLCTFLSCTSVGQIKFESFPNLSDFIDTNYGQEDNLLPIAIITFPFEGKEYKIPISYSILHHSVDSSNFLIKGDFIDNYSFKILDNGKFMPMFKKEALLLPLTGYLI